MLLYFERLSGEVLCISGIPKDLTESASMTFLKSLVCKTFFEFVRPSFSFRGGRLRRVGGTPLQLVLRTERLRVWGVQFFPFNLGDKKKRQCPNHLPLVETMCFPSSSKFKDHYFGPNLTEISRRLEGHQRHFGGHFWDLTLFNNQHVYASLMYL